MDRHDQLARLVRINRVPLRGRPLPERAGALAGRSLVVASLLVGAALVIAMLPFPSPFSLPSGSG
jgi:hypothetical protein